MFASIAGKVRQHVNTYRQLGDLLRAYVVDHKAFGAKDPRVKRRAEAALAYVRDHAEAFE